MVTVSNTSPISNLAIIGRLDLLQSQFANVLIPVAVERELRNIPHRKAWVVIDDAIRSGWLKCHPVSNLQLAGALTGELDLGEAEAIALAIEVQAHVLLIDERDGRTVARRAGIIVRGVLGILVRAKAAGAIHTLASEIHALRTDAGFYIAPRPGSRSAIKRR